MTKPFTTEMQRKKCAGCYEPDYLNHNGLCGRCQHIEHLQNFADNCAAMRLGSDSDNRVMLTAIIDSAKLVRSDR